MKQLLERNPRYFSHIREEAKLRELKLEHLRIHLEATAYPFDSFMYDHKTSELPDKSIERLAHSGTITQQREILKQRIRQLLGEGSSELFEYRQGLSLDEFKIRIEAVQKVMNLQEKQLRKQADELLTQSTDKL